MSTPYFFGYGSLVNRATHVYPNASHAVAKGWRRAWVHTSLRPYAYLSAIRDPGSKITGLVAQVPQGDWTALDAREHAYDRISDTHNIEHTDPNAVEVSIYSVRTEHTSKAADAHPVLLSYVDVVIQGYLREFGEQGASEFFETTSGWDAPVLDDRAAPKYARHQELTAEETAFVDDGLQARRVRILGR